MFANDFNLVSNAAEIMRLVNQLETYGKFDKKQVEVRLADYEHQGPRPSYAYPVIFLPKGGEDRKAYLLMNVGGGTGCDFIAVRFVYDYNDKVGVLGEDSVIVSRFISLRTGWDTTFDNGDAFWTWLKKEDERIRNQQAETRRAQEEVTARKQREQAETRATQDRAIAKLDAYKSKFFPLLQRMMKKEKAGQAEPTKLSITYTAEHTVVESTDIDEFAAVIDAIKKDVEYHCGARSIECFEQLQHAAYGIFNLGFSGLLVPGRERTQPDRFQYRLTWNHTNGYCRVQINTYTGATFDVDFHVKKFPMQIPSSK